MAKKTKRPFGIAAVLCIGRGRYRLTGIRTDLHDRAWELRKKDGTVYHLTEGPDGLVACDCPGFVYRDKCKHVSAFKGLGLVPVEPTPVPAGRHINVYC